MSGEHGSSAGGLKLLQDNKTDDDLINAHLSPKAQTEFSEKLSANIKEDYAMMDTSDGLADALFKIAKASDKTILIDFEKVPYNKKLKELFPKEYKDLILYGGEDYQIIATVSEDFAVKNNLHIIGTVGKKQDNTVLKIKNYDNQDLIINNLDKCFNHF